MHESPCKASRGGSRCLIRFDERAAKDRNFAARFCVQEKPAKYRVSERGLCDPISVSIAWPLQQKVRSRM